MNITVQQRRDIVFLRKTCQNQTQKEDFFGCESSESWKKKASWLFPGIVLLSIGRSFLGGILY